jgi:hypothetical protein
MRSRAALANSDRDTMNGTLKRHVYRHCCTFSCYSPVAEANRTHLVMAAGPLWVQQLRSQPIPHLCRFCGVVTQAGYTHAELRGTR